MAGRVVATAGFTAGDLARPAGKASAPGRGLHWRDLLVYDASASFANPAAVAGRMVSDTFAGIAPSSAPGFMAAQLLGALLGWLLARALTPASSTSLFKMTDTTIFLAPSAAPLTQHPGFDPVPASSPG